MACSISQTSAWVDFAIDHKLLDRCALQFRKRNVWLLFECFLRQTGYWVKSCQASLWKTLFPRWQVSYRFSLWKPELDRQGISIVRSYVWCHRFQESQKVDLELVLLSLRLTWRQSRCFDSGSRKVCSIECQHAISPHNQVAPVPRALLKCW